MSTPAPPSLGEVLFLWAKSLTLTASMDPSPPEGSCSNWGCSRGDQTAQASGASAGV